MTETVIIFANKPNKLSFNVEVMGVEQSSLQPRLSIFCDKSTLSFPLKHENDNKWTAEVEYGFQDVGVCSAKGKIEIICNGHFLESDEFSVDIKGEVKVTNATKPVESEVVEQPKSPTYTQPSTTTFQSTIPSPDRQSTPPVADQPAQQPDEQQAQLAPKPSKDAAVLDLIQSIGMSPKRTKFKGSPLRDFMRKQQ